MKIRNGFVSNSSSSSFVIENKTKRELTVEDFIKENPQLIEEFNKDYSYKYTLEEVLEDKAECALELDPGENELIFGDEFGTPVNHIFDYALRDGGESERFKWYLVGYNR